MAARTARSLTPAPPPILGPVLVTGGCGFLGYHLVAHLLADPERGSGRVYVLDRHVANSENRHAGDDGNVTYIEGSVTDAALVASVLQETRPRVIFHAASPPASLPPPRWPEFEATNVTGTAILLAAAAASETVRAFVYTSSADVYADPPHHNVTETHPLVAASEYRARRGVGVTEYMRTKAAGQRLVLAANTPALRTCALLPAHMYGERSSQGLREILDLCDDGGDGRGWWPRPPLVQLGAGNNLMDVASAANVAQAHILAAKALVEPDRTRGVVAGQSFNVTDGRPVAFWNEHVRAVWKEARGGRRTRARECHRGARVGVCGDRLGGEDALLGADVGDGVGTRGVLRASDSVFSWGAYI
ncbi:hypothetical protein PG999_010777 [Apiospora kogelbergensis]|uniref:Ketoreductase domain-containing protein n=1 Tax=Apiospora kogelbergensis TaxID=1337665 RepID=A0AAW0QGR9_9PEZI